MSEISQEIAQRMATLLSGSIKGVGFYPSGHPAILNPLKEIVTIVEAALRARPEVRLGVVDGVLFVEKQLFFAPSTSIEELATRLQEKEITGIILSPGINVSGLARFVTLLGKNQLKAEQINTEISSQGITGLSIITAMDEDQEEIQQEEACLRTRHEALETVEQIFREVELGRIPGSDRISTVVREMASLAVKDSAALLALSMIKDYDNYTFNHSVNVGVISMTIASHMNLGREEIETVGMAGFLHDVGKVRIEKSILNKPGKLTTIEYEEMKKHTESGIEIIDKMKGINSKVAQAVLGHHIGYNRKGYPEWAREMPFTSMSEIVAAADCYDAITTVRVYQKPYNPREAIAHLQIIAGSYLNGDIVDKFKEMMGPYPVGTVVRLDNNEIAIVYRPNLQVPEAPKVKIVMDAAGRRLAMPLRRKLADEKGNTYARIVAVVDPLVKNIDIAGCLNMSSAR
ncbi:cyclic diguanylate phosphodiesterase [Geotalea daltonii FRC-32]|uniref:Cyclic diguanylate phosphodiesterase n=1 Tax=Geotalea daltonii (strain DSM 22248 / JCM 15807 / FRC-32) TaxID=316067 RepID=B9M723_GEODF|nr:HD domain-containing phosphohydrolase [Geotalea daltonii]ACM22044.1 cyclic diguanylate phosphodiesterase [Geotalea daltonii FRC-32]